MLKEQLRDLYQTLSALEAAYLTNKIVFFKANPKQSLATKLLNEKGVYTVVVPGSNRSGKTTWNISEVIAHALGYRPWLSADHPDRIVRLANGKPIPVPNIGRVLAQNYQQAIQQTIWQKLREWAPRESFTIKKDNRGIPVEIDWNNGSVTYLMSNDQEDSAFEGPNGHYFSVDEPCDYNKFIGLKRGLVDFSGHAWLSFTHISQPWMADELIHKANEDKGNIRLVRFNIWDNCIDNGGYLSREDIQEFIDSLRDEEKEARIYGYSLHLAGRVFKSWLPEPPYWIDPFELPLKWPRVCVIDPHPRKPIAVMWAAISPDNQIYVYRDLFDPMVKTVADCVERIRELERKEDVTLRVIDSSSRQNERTSGDSVWRRFAVEGMPVQIAPKQNADAGFDAIHDALSLGKYEWGEPQLMVFNNCRHVKNDFLNFCYDDWSSGKQRDLKGEKQDYRKVHDDFISCIRYIFQLGVNYYMLRGHAFDKRRNERAGDDNMRGLRGPGDRTKRVPKYARGLGVYGGIR